MATEAQPQTSDPSESEKRKAFIPLENNPEVMTSLVHTLGLSPTLSFHDVFSLTDPDLLAFVPRPAYALLLVFPVSKVYEEFRVAEDGEREEYRGVGEGEPVVWFRQTIRNACGLIGLLHGVCNGEARDFIEPNSDLAALLKAALPLPPDQRADLLYASSALETAHAAAAAKGDTAPPSAEESVDLHYVCFVKSKTDGHLWELDGRRKGPLDRGALGEGEDVLCERALEMGVRGFLRREEEAGKKEGGGGGEMRFSIVVLAPGWE